MAKTSSADKSIVELINILCGCSKTVDAAARQRSVYEMKKAADLCCSTDSEGNVYLYSRGEALYSGKNDRLMSEKYNLTAVKLIHEAIDKFGTSESDFAKSTFGLGKVPNGIQVINLVSNDGYDTVSYWFVGSDSDIVKRIKTTDADLKGENAWEKAGTR